MKGMRVEQFFTRTGRRQHTDNVVSITSIVTALGRRAVILVTEDRQPYVLTCLFFDDGPITITEQGQ